MRGRRLRIFYASQVASGPPRFRVHVNDRKLIVRDYAFFFENRLRERYRLEGVPLVIDFADRARSRHEGKAGRKRKQKRSDEVLALRDSGPGSRRAA